MPSILPEYEYDIFISYRQNDNRSDKWVSNFVNALKEELTATLKNPVSIYFDENPHDGLLETHQVDASLAKKLKCLVFIPIISQTYCDENSFAWAHEFIPFIKMAKEDELGMNITLSNGNVTSRVLPVKIHDLDSEDQHTLEAVLDGPLRSIDFIYSEPGVNRPLKPNDDRNLNLEKTDYQNQINKVANALKDIGVSMLKSTKTELEEPLAKAANVRSKTTAPGTSISKQKIVVSLAILAVLILAFLGLKPLLFQGEEVKEIGEVGLAIMPLKNISEGAEIGFLSFALKDEIHEVLALSKKFAFLSSAQATASYKDKEVTPQIIGDELGVDYVLSGSYQISGDQLNVRVEFSDAQSGNSIWTHKFIVKYEEANIFPMQADIAQKVLAIFNESDEKISSVKQNINFASYDHYIKGLELRQKGWQLETTLKAINEFEQAINLDSTHKQSWIELIAVKSALIFMELVEKNDYLSEIESHLDFISENHPQWAAELAQGIYQYHVLSNYEEGLKHFKKVVERYPDNETANNLIGAIYKRKLRLTDAYNSRLKLISSNPQNTLYWLELSVLFWANGDYRRQLQAFNRALELGLDSSYYSALPRMYQKASIPLDSIPKKYIVSTNKRSGFDELWDGHNPRTIINHIKNIKIDRNPGRGRYAKTEFYLDMALAYQALYMDDSSKYFSQLCISENEKQEENEWYLVDQAYSIIGQVEKSIEIYNKEVQLDSEDFWDLVSLKERRIRFLVLSKKFEEATEMLLEINREYPEYGDFYFLNNIIYDRAKKESPPFAEAVANLKLPPSLVEDNQLERLKY